jgi:hypothetical protein
MLKANLGATSGAMALSTSGYFFKRKITMKTAILAALVASAAAFAPSQQQATSTSLAGSYDDALGVQNPLGFWYVERGYQWCHRKKGSP